MNGIRSKYYKTLSRKAKHDSTKNVKPCCQSSSIKSHFDGSSSYIELFLSLIFTDDEKFWHENPLDDKNNDDEDHVLLGCCYEVYSVSLQGLFEQLGLL